jgi:hypothetical protein
MRVFRAYRPRGLPFGLNKEALGYTTNYLTYCMYVSAESL